MRKKTWNLSVCSQKFNDLSYIMPVFSKSTNDCVFCINPDISRLCSLSHLGSVGEMKDVGCCDELPAWNSLREDILTPQKWFMLLGKGSENRQRPAYVPFFPFLIPWLLTIVSTWIVLLFICYLLLFKYVPLFCENHI